MEQISDEEKIYNANIRVFDELASTLNPNLNKVKSALEYVSNKLTYMKNNNMKSLYYYYYEKIKASIFYYEAGYVEEFEEFLDKYLNEIKFERDCINRLQKILNVIKNQKDYTFLKWIYVISVSIDKMQNIRYACIDMQEEILHNSNSFISYIPNDDVDLSDQGFLDQLENDIDSIEKNVRVQKAN